LADTLPKTTPQLLDSGSNAYGNAARQAAARPLAGRVVPELQRNDVREVFLRTHRIVYRVRKGTIDVLTVFEGHRLFEADTLTELDQ